MERVMVVEMVQEKKNDGIITAAIIGDDDASTIAKLHQTIDPNIDKNHVKKNLSNCLYELKVTYPTLTNRVRFSIHVGINYRGNPQLITFNYW